MTPEVTRCSVTQCQPMEDLGYDHLRGLGQVLGSALQRQTALVLDVETHEFRLRELAQVVVTEAHRWVFGHAMRLQT